MCNLFASQDPATYASETRAIRLNGHATSLRLEAAFWSILERIAAAEGTSVARFVSALHDEVLDRQGEVSNLASLLRVSCLHWLRNQELHARGDAHEGGAAARHDRAHDHALGRAAATGAPGRETRVN